MKVLLFGGDPPPTPSENRDGHPAKGAALRLRLRLGQCIAAGMRFVACLAFLIPAACGPHPAAGDQPPFCGEAPLLFDPGGAVVQGHSDDGLSCARLERRAVEQGPDVFCFACPYDPVRLVAVAGGHFVDVNAADRLSYTATHHNWADEMRGEDDDVSALVRLLYVVSDDSWNLELTFLQAEVPVEGPVTFQASN